MIPIVVGVAASCGAPPRAGSESAPHSALAAGTRPEADVDFQKLVEQWQYPAPVPNFELIDQDGRRFRLAELGRAHVLVGFVFTSCSVPKACPLTMEKMRQVQDIWAERVRRGKTHGRDLRLLSLTIDPENDTPERLKEYGEAHHADFAVWTLATGPERLMQEGLPSIFGVLALPDGRGSISHSVKAALLAPGLREIKAWDDNAFEPGDVVEAVLGTAGVTLPERDAAR